jgi:dTDP-4-dehydrorhamnose reductase
MLGSEMMLVLADHGHEVLGFNRENLNLDDSVEGIARQLEGFDAVVNAVAYTAVDKAESESELANLVNGDYAGKLASASKIVGAKFLHLSTDYVFDGDSEVPYILDAIQNPQGAYGRSKLLGEQLIEQSGSNYTIFRTAWLYGVHGRCFPKVIHEKTLRGEPLKVVNEQFGQPTWTKDLAELIIAHQDLEANVRPRMVHATASGRCSWYEFACEIALSLGYDSEQVIIPITTAEYPTPAKRPAYSVLDNQNETGLVIGDWKERWREAAPLVLAEYLK